MAQVAVTLEEIQHRYQRKHVYPVPISTTIGVGDNYTLTESGTGSTILDNLTETEFTVSESVSVMSGLLKSSIDVVLQDQTTPTFTGHFNKLIVSTTTAADLAIGDTTIEVADATGFAIGEGIILFSVADVRYYLAHIVSIVSTTITVDSPLDFAYASGTIVNVVNHNLAVNGSVTPQIFGIRGTESEVGVPISLDITKIIIVCITTGLNTLSTFGNIAALTKGIFLRKRDGEYTNILNWHTNGDIVNTVGPGEFEIYTATNPNQGTDGFIGRLNIAGQNELGVAIRIGANEDLEFIIQDDLTGITSLTIIALGSVVDPN